MTEAYEYGTVTCAQEGCTASVKNHRWGKIKAEDWFFQKNGLAWCPQHIPEWVSAWRKSRA